MAAQAAQLDGATEVRDVHLKVDTRFANVKVVGEEGMEARDKNRPRNLHNAAELFLKVGMASNARRLQQTTSALFELLAAGPDASVPGLKEFAERLWLFKDLNLKTIEAVAGFATSAPLGVLLEATTSAAKLRIARYVAEYLECLSRVLHLAPGGGVAYSGPRADWSEPPAPLY